MLHFREDDSNQLYPDRPVLRTLIIRRCHLNMIVLLDKAEREQPGTSSQPAEYNGRLRSHLPREEYERIVRESSKDPQYLEELPNETHHDYLNRIEVDLKADIENIKENVTAISWNSATNFVRVLLRSYADLVQKVKDAGEPVAVDIVAYLKAAWIMHATSGRELEPVKKQNFDEPEVPLGIHNAVWGIDES